jgi:hypothetical protein
LLLEATTWSQQLLLQMQMQLLQMQLLLLADAADADAAADDAAIVLWGCQLPS